jgi:hypothetical protein
MQTTFEVDGAPLPATISTLVIAGWTGRDPEAVEQHIAELAALGVARPRTVPMFYRLGAALLTTETDIEVVGGDSSGEVEFVLVSIAGDTYVGVGSDHTDRTVEAYGVTVSKQVCPKPVGKTLWRLADVEPHWDRLVLRSFVFRDDERTPYQEGPVTRMLDPRELMQRLAGEGGAGLPEGTAMFCGTLPVIGGIGGGDGFELELHDPVLKRTLHHAYRVRSLAIAD